MNETFLTSSSTPLSNENLQRLLLMDAAVNAAANGIAITDLDGKFIWVNPAFSQITGYSQEEAIGKKPSILKSGLEDNSFYENIWKTITSGKVWSGNIRNKRKDGTIYFEEQIIAPVKNAEGRITNYIGIKQNVTERVEAQRALERRNEELSELNHAISIITSSLNLAEIEKNIVETVKHILPQAFGATLQLIDENGNLYTKTVSKYVQELKPEICFQPGMGAAGIALKEKRPINIGDVQSDPRFVKRKNTPPFQSLISIPISFKETLFGTLSVEGKTVNAFSEQDERILQLLADYAAAAIQNALYSEHLSEMVDERTLELQLAQERIYMQQQMEQEIQLAAQIQESLLPSSLPRIPGYELAAVALPAHSVSGDFYDLLTDENGVLNLIVADIAGKGVPAAILTSTARTLMRIACKEQETPARTLIEVNTQIYEDLSRAGMFITMLHVRLDSSTGRVAYANAGHTQALLWHSSSHINQLIPATGIPLGIMPDSMLDELELEFRPDDILVLYSDGITEAMDPEDHFFGIDRLREIVSKNSTQSPEELLKLIIYHVDDFCMGRPHSDDITLIVLKALPKNISAIFQANFDQLDAISQLLRNTARGYGAEFAYQVDLACSEIVTNIIKHAYKEHSGELNVEINTFNNKIEINFHDQGDVFDINALPEVDLSQPHEGGYGLYLVKQLMDKVEYTPNTTRGNHWHLLKSLHEEDIT